MVKRYLMAKLSPVDLPAPTPDSYAGIMAALRLACEAHAAKKPPRKDGSKEGSVGCQVCGGRVHYRVERSGLLAARCQSMTCCGIV